MESSFEKIRKNFFGTVIPFIIKAVLIFIVVGMVLFIGSQYEQLFTGNKF
jgi:hypothetical protein